MKRILAIAVLAFVTFTGVAADAKNISVAEAAKIIKSDTNVVVLDVRTPEEFKSGHIKGAKNIDFNDKDFAKKMDELDKSKTYIIHCAAGGRSGRACKQVSSMKFKKMLHMNEGFSKWEESGQAVEK